MSAHPNPNPEQTRREDQLKIGAVTNRKSLAADKLVAERIPLGEPDDYKPCIAKLPSGELLLTAFHQHQRDGNKVMEQTWLFRSPNGGRTWQSTRIESAGIKPKARASTTVLSLNSIGT